MIEYKNTKKILRNFVIISVMVALILIHYDLMLSYHAEALFGAFGLLIGCLLVQSIAYAVEDHDTNKKEQKNDE